LARCARLTGYGSRNRSRQAIRPKRPLNLRSNFRMEPTRNPKLLRTCIPRQVATAHARSKCRYLHRGYSIQRTAVEGSFLEMPSRWAARASLCSISTAITQHRRNHNASFTQTTRIR
jgi:hypothetical protein